MNVHTAYIFISSLAVIIFIIYIYFKWSFQYWKRKGVPFLMPRIPFGNVENTFSGKRAPGVVAKDNYNELKRKGVKFGGIYSLSAPVFVAIHPDIIKNILSKDFR